MLASAQTSIDFYFPYIADSEMQEIFINRAQDGIVIQWVIDENFLEDGQEIISSFQKSWIDITFPENQKIHAKAILIDTSILYIWSINFSTYSFDENREIGLITTDENIISNFLRVFEEDFRK